MNIFQECETGFRTTRINNAFDTLPNFYNLEAFVKTERIILVKYIKCVYVQMHEWETAQLLFRCNFYQKLF